MSSVRVSPVPRSLLESQIRRRHRKTPLALITQMPAEALSQHKEDTRSYTRISTKTTSSAVVAKVVSPFRRSRLPSPPRGPAWQQTQVEAENCLPPHWRRWRRWWCWRSCWWHRLAAGYRLVRYSVTRSSPRPSAGELEAGVSKVLA